MLLWPLLPGITLRMVAASPPEGRGSFEVDGPKSSNHIHRARSAGNDLRTQEKKISLVFYPHPPPPSAVHLFFVKLVESELIFA